MYDGILCDGLVKDIEALAQRISSKMIISERQLQPWNAVEMTVKDLDGHLITLTQLNREEVAFDSLMKETAQHF